VREVVLQQVSLGSQRADCVSGLPLGRPSINVSGDAAIRLCRDGHDAELYVQYLGGVPDITRLLRISALLSLL
jgi:hypothetical protein